MSAVRLVVCYMVHPIPALVSSVSGLRSHTPHKPAALTPTRSPSCLCLSCTVTVTIRLTTLSTPQNFSLHPPRPWTYIFHQPSPTHITFTERLVYQPTRLHALSSGLLEWHMQCLSIIPSVTVPGKISPQVFPRKNHAERSLTNAEKSGYRHIRLTLGLDLDRQRLSIRARPRTEGWQGRDSTGYWRLTLKSSLVLTDPAVRCK